MKQSKESSRRGSKAEWVALMAMIAELDRDEYRELRQEAWDSVTLVASSTKTN